MIHIFTLFDYRKDPPRPLCALTFKNNKPKFHVLYAPKTGLTLYEIEQNKSRIFEDILNEPIIVNDIKSHLQFFKFENQQLYESNVIYDQAIPDDIKKYKEICISNIRDSLKIKSDNWRAILANVQFIYDELEKTGVIVNNRTQHPKYGFTFTGRSKTSRFNIQGETDSEIYHVNPYYDYIVHLDWIAADLRIASILSQDQRLLESFNNSDPYSYMANSLNKIGGEGKVTRDQCKSNLFRCLYSLNFDGPSMLFYPKFREWSIETSSNIEVFNYSTSILGRQFFLSEDRTIKSLFNAIFQGSVAHAIQIVLSRIKNLFPDNLLAEKHDAIVLACEKNMLSDLINNVSQIMLNPFKGELSSNPNFPLRVSIGKRWYQWKLYKVFR